jgi:uridine kinase
MQATDLRDMVLDKLVQCVAFSKGLSIAGPGCAGKSTFAAELAARLRGRRVEATVLDLDGYLMPRAERARAGLSAYHPDAYDLSQARRDIERLTGGGEVAVRTYDKVTGTTHDAGFLKLRDVLIVEGALALHDAMRGISPLSIFLDASTQTLFENRR